MENKFKTFKIKDLPKDFDLVGCKLGEQIIFSGWAKGFWVKNKMTDSQTFPVFFKNFDEIKDWKIKVPIERTLNLK